MTHPSDEQRTRCASQTNVVKANPNIELARQLARENDAELRRSFRALDAARTLTVSDLRIQFRV